MNEREPVAWTTVRPLRCQLAHQRQRNHTLATAGTAGDDHGRLLIACPSLLDRVHHQTECDGLLVQKHKLLPVGKLFRHNGEELA